MRPLFVFLTLLPLLAQEAPKPAEQATAAAQEATKPSGKETAKPADQEAKPADQEAKPAEQAAAPAAPTASEKMLTGSIDFGYRWRSDVRGNSDAYRSVVNLGEGPKVFGFDFELRSATKKFFDKINLFGTGWGGDPYNTARIDMNKERRYDFKADYRNIAYYNFLPSFANPLLGAAPSFNQRSYDITRRLIDSELRLRPGTRIIPFFSFSRDWGEGYGITTFVSNSNEYPVQNQLSDHTDRYRGGFNLEFKNFHATLEQGGTKFGDDQLVAHAGPRMPGNRSTPIFNQDLFLTSLTQRYQITGDSIFSRGLVTFTPRSWVDLSGQFLYSRPETTVNYQQNNAGNFINLTTAQFFATQQDFLTANANQPHSSGNVNVVVRPSRRMRILETWMTDRFETASSAALSELTNLTAQAIQSLATDRLKVGYSRQQAQVDVDVTPWLTLRGGHRYVYGRSTVRSPQVNGTGSDAGELQQHVALAGAQFRPVQKLWINADAEVGRADRTYFRTSLRDYDKVSLRGRYQILSTLTFTASASQLKNENANPEINLDFDSRRVSGGFFWNPKGSKRFTVLGDYTRSWLKSNINYIVPNTGTVDVSRYVDNAHTATGLLDISPLKLKNSPQFSVGGSFFHSTGSRPTEYYQPLIKLSLPVHEKVALFSEWRWHGLSETFYQYEGFRAHLFLVGLRLLR